MRHIRIFCWSLRRDLATFSRNPWKRAAAHTWETPEEAKQGLRRDYRRPKL
jgi:hypothetical protein